MEMIIWIALCFFASVGLVQCGFWVIEMVKTGGVHRKIFHVLPVYDEPNDVEFELRDSMKRLSYAEQCGDDIIILDMGLSDASRVICEKIIDGCYGVYMTDQAHLSDTIRLLDNLQNPLNDVE